VIRRTNGTQFRHQEREKGPETGPKRSGRSRALASDSADSRTPTPTRRNAAQHSVGQLGGNGPGARVAPSGRYLGEKLVGHTHVVRPRDSHFIRLRDDLAQPAARIHEHILVVVAGAHSSNDQTCLNARPRRAPSAPVLAWGRSRASPNPAAVKLRLALVRLR
jgi:hypothetical protein